MAPERKVESDLTEAAARTAGVLRTLQSRLSRATAAPATEDPEELGNQLREYFAASTEASSCSAEVPPARDSSGVSPSPRVSNDIRQLVIAGAVDRILRSWEESNAGLSALKSEVIERLVEQLLAETPAKGPTPGSTR
jgi:hypothetical protein